MYEFEFTIHPCCFPQFDDADNESRFKVPVPLNLTNSDTGPDNRLYTVEVTGTPTFSLKISRKQTGTVL